MLSERIKNISPSMTLELTGKIAELRAKGVDIIGFNLGEPDFGTPENICKAAEAAIKTQKTKYTPVSGIVPLRQAIADKLKRENNIEYTASQICVGTGAKQPLVNAVLTLCQKGDQVIVLAPCWVSYIEMIKLAGAEPVIVQNREEKGFSLNLKAIEENITNKTKAILINTPNNPTGAVYSKESLVKLAELACKHNFYIISDEVYEKLIYGDKEHFSVASVSEEVKNRTVTINGLSKAYAMTGWRVGYAAASSEVIKGMTDLQGHMTSNTCSIAQYAALEALTGPQEALNIMKKEFDKRRLYLLDRLNSIESITCVKPEGAFYLMPNVSKYYGKRYNGKVIKDSFDISAFLLEEARIALVPGAAFESPANLRISYSNSMENLMEGMKRMEEALGKLRD